MPSHAYRRISSYPLTNPNHPISLIFPKLSPSPIYSFPALHLPLITLINLTLIIYLYLTLSLIAIAFINLYFLSHSPPLNFLISSQTFPLTNHLSPLSISLSHKLNLTHHFPKMSIYNLIKFNLKSQFSLPISCPNFPQFTYLLSQSTHPQITQFLQFSNPK